jgi:hypothetical protein
MSEALKNKLENFEAEPSPKVWQEVQNALEDEQYTLREKLLSYQQQPPADLWGKIETSLGNDAEVINIKRNHNPFFKYAMIAAALFLAVIAINLLIKPKHKNEVAVTKPSDTGHQQKTEIPAVVSLPSKPKVEPATNTALASNIKDTSARYLTVSHDDGTKVRLSKKIYPVINCAENTGSANWSKCKENIQALQAKMATSVSASGTDFGGLMDMLKDLEENH